MGGSLAPLAGAGLVQVHWRSEGWRPLCALARQRTVGSGGLDSERAQRYQGAGPAPRTDDF